MNQRLEQLAVEAKELAEQAFREDNAKRFTVMEKFAELIVRECLNQCYHRGMNDELYEGQLKAAAFIEEHFGVEE